MISSKQQNGVMVLQIVLGLHNAVHVWNDAQKSYYTR